ncbi:MAG: DUF3794 domain-containing protein [Clostridia bacterium]|nr:DUF3794 domain-containing protein [Clostridia bacterium]
MDINTINEKVQISRFVKNENIVEIVEGDIIVPDIKPDILKLSRVDGNVYITKKEIQDGSLKIDGIIDTYVLYVADNETNQIKGINTVLNFNENLDMPELNNNMDVSLNYSLGNIEHKIVNGRKISVKCPVDITVGITENKNIEVIKDLEGANSIQKQTKKLTFNELVASGFENVSVKETATIPNDLPPIGEILRVCGSLEDKDFKVSYNKLLAKCDMKVRVVYIADTEKGEIEAFETRIPVTGFIDLNGISEQMRFDVDYNLSYLYLKPVYQDLKANSISIEGELEFCARAYDSRTLEVVADVYNPEHEIKYDIECNDMKCKNKLASEKVKIDQLVTVPELMNSTLLDLNVKPVITDKHFMDDKLSLNGSLDLDISYYNRDKNIVETKKIELPFKQSIKLNKKVNENDVSISLCIEYAKYDLQSSGQLQFESQFAIDVFDLDNVEFNTINNIIQTDEEMMPVASVVIYYVKPGDTLWKIAKEYRSTIESIMQVNDLKDDKVYPGQQLIIPKKVYRVSLDAIS